MKWIQIAHRRGYRIFIADAYSFHRHLRYAIEHSGEGNNIPTYYVGTTFYYLDNPEGRTARLSEVAARSVMGPESLLATFGISPPPIADLQGASLEMKSTHIGDEDVYFASLTRHVINDFHPIPNSNCFDTDIGPPDLALSPGAPEAGDYAIVVEGLTGPQRSMLQLRVDDQPVGREADFYAPTSGRSGPQQLQCYISRRVRIFCM